MDTIEELYGINQTPSGHINGTTELDPFQTSGQNHNQGSPLVLPVSIVATPWQSNITNHMKNHDAMFVLAAPAAGKTAPLVGAMHSLIRDADKRGVHPKSPNFPRILYVSPRTQLANQAIINDFTLDNRHGAIMYAAAMMLAHGNISTKDVAELAKLTDARSRIDPAQQRRLLEWLYTNFVAVVAGSSGSLSTVTSPIFKVKPIIGATYTFAEKILSKYSSYIDIVIIDELQEYMPKPGKPSLIDDKMANALIKILTTTLSSKKGLILATGSVNVNSAKQFVDFLETKFKRKIHFDLTIKDSNRSKLTLIPFTKMRNSLELADLAKDLISSNKTNNVVITFTKKEKPASQLSILTTVQLLLKRLPVVNKEFLYSKARKTETVGSFADKEVNSNFGEKPKHEQPLRGDEFRNIDDIEELKYFNISDMMSSKDGEAIHTTKADVDNLLFQSVLRGYGFILGGMEDRQKAIIQKLFMNNKLQVLFATDAIGVGANVLSHNLFLPSLYKFEDATFGQVNTSSLIQLINRAGRKGAAGGIPYANVYVQQKDLELARQVLMSDPHIGAGEIDIDFTRKELSDKMTSSQQFKLMFSNMFPRRR